MYVYECVLVWAYVHKPAGVLGEPEEGTRSTELREVQVWWYYLTWVLGTLQQQWALLTAEPSL